jgi:ATP-dependent DNA helicase DinG
VELEEIFSPNGPIKKFFPDFSQRDDQTEMAVELYKSFQNEKNIIIEAGTGIGKSIAYLVPAVLYCIQEGKRLTISTETKTLQNQLLEKEIPLVKKVIYELTGSNVKTDLCLGSSNYICTKRFQQTATGGKLSPREIKSLEKLSIKLTNNESINRLNTNVSITLWNLINRDSDLCLHSQCMHFTDCSFQNAKRSWQSSTVLVVNHYLFFSHIATGRTYLPYSDIIIFDEAHGINDICRKQLGFEINETYLRKELPMDFFIKTFSTLGNHEIKNEILQTVQLVHEKFDNLFQVLKRISGENRTFLLPKPLYSTSILADEIKKVLHHIETLEKIEKDEYDVFEVESIKAKLLSLYRIVLVISGQDDPDWVYWIEKPEEIVLVAQLIDVAKIMVQDVVPYFTSIAAVSATLMTGQTFDYFKSQNGFEEFEEKLFKSIFPYDKNVLLYLDPDFPLVNSEEFPDRCVQHILEIAAITQGNILALFHSYKLLNQCAIKIEEIYENSVISQVAYSPVEAIQLFKNEKKPILLGTHSFWQGVDLPGDLLKAVVLTQLPFPSPGRADIQALSDKIKREGKNPFKELYLPFAILKFRQGFGRLMRSNEDSGIISVIDSRIVNKEYGKAFLESIPQCIYVSTLDELESAYKKLTSIIPE